MVTPGSDRPAAEPTRELAGRVVHGIYRLVKGCLLHDDGNQAIAQLVEALVTAVGDYCEAAKTTHVGVLFAANNVFVDRQMLRTSRETYQLALELGHMIESFGVTELSFSHPLDRAEAQELGRTIALAQRDKSLAQKDRLTRFESIRARRIVAFQGGPKLTPVQRAARTYAASVLIVQAFYRQMREGMTELPHNVKRVAQRLVTAAEDDARLLLVIAASPTSEHDRAAAAVSSAIIALAMARQLVVDRSALLGLASAAILYDVGRPRLMRSATAAGAERSLSDAEQEKLPASTVASLTALGKLHQGSLARSVIAYEALALRLGAARVYGGRRPPSVLARVLHAARTFVEARATRGGSVGAGSMDDAVQVLFGQARDATERTFAKLVLGALGLFPAGTLVELTTGELAVVTATPKLPIDFARPPVRILYDAEANQLEDPIDCDLAARSADGAPPRLIRRIVDADDQQMRQMRAYVAGLSTAATRSPRRPVTAPRAQLASAAAPGAPAPQPPVFTSPEPAPVAAAAAAAREAAATISPSRRIETIPARSPATPAARPSTADATAASTRAMSWDQYGHIVSDEAAAEQRTPTQPPAPGALEATDALLAAFLDESPSRSGGKAGLRWGTETPSSGKADDSPSSGRYPPSSGGGPSSSSSGSDGSDRPSFAGGDPPSSHSPRSRVLAGRTRTRTKDWTVGSRSPPPLRGSQPPRPPSQPPVPPPPPELARPPMSRKPKAGSSGWGSDKK